MDPLDATTNQPRQQRSRETLDRLLRATRELLEDRVFEDLTIQQIATRAGCSVGTVYGRFRNKDAILPRLLEMHYEELEAETEATFDPEAWRASSLSDRVGLVVEFLVSVAIRQPGLIRTLVLRNYQRPESIPVSIRASAGRVLGRVHEFLLEGSAEMSHPDPHTAVQIGLLMVVSASRERLVMTGATHSSALSFSNEVFVDELKRSLLAYLTAA